MRGLEEGGLIFYWWRHVVVTARAAREAGGLLHCGDHAWRRGETVGHSVSGARGREHVWAPPLTSHRDLLR